MTTKKRPWQQMRLSQVGNLADVMQTKSGLLTDSSGPHNYARGIG
jgi:hypothetical protein